MIILFNSLSRKKEALTFQKRNKLTMYVCGPTVYGPSHLGHARTYISFDIIRRFLEFSGTNVKMVINITDVHDDMIKEANKQKITIFELGKKFSKEFFECMKALNVRPANEYPKVTEHISEIIQAVKVLKEKGFAYETEDGVYFDISKFKNYGKLSGIKLKKQETGKRIETDKYEKEEARDFALWKKEKPGEPSWDSEFGKGRPGWHIECSVMAEKHLGLPVDIHCGAKDLVFPHHENEIAQSEAFSGKKPFVRYWIHSGLLMVEGQKMAKSLGNFITIPELLKKHDSRIFRFMVSQINYDSAFDYTEQKMMQAEKTLESLDLLVNSLISLNEEKQENKEATAFVKETKKKFVESMNENFNASKAFASVFDLQRKTNKLIAGKKIGKKDAKNILNFLKEFNEVFEVFEFKEKKELPEELKKLVDERNSLRKKGKYEESDKIRKKLLDKGIILDDSGKETKWRFV